VFGDRLKELREDYKITQEELGKLLNVSKQAISQYERGENEPSFESLVKLADKFDVSLDYLLGRTRNKINLCLKDKSMQSLVLDIAKLLDNYEIHRK
jgi:transcriptional regulator with XRE-family HTH domain